MLELGKKVQCSPPPSWGRQSRPGWRAPPPAAWPGGPAQTPALQPSLGSPVLAGNGGMRAAGKGGWGAAELASCFRPHACISAGTARVAQTAALSCMHARPMHPASRKFASACCGPAPQPTPVRRRADLEAVHEVPKLGPSLLLTQPNGLEHLLLDVTPAQRAQRSTAQRSAAQRAERGQGSARAGVAAELRSGARTFPAPSCPGWHSTACGTCTACPTHTQHAQRVQHSMHSVPSAACPAQRACRCAGCRRQSPPHCTPGRRPGPWRSGGPPSAVRGTTEGRERGSHAGWAGRSGGAPSAAGAQKGRRKEGRERGVTQGGRGEEGFQAGRS